MNFIPLGYYAFSGLVNCLTSFGLAGLVVLRSPKSTVNRLFGIFAALVGGWSLFYFLWLTTSDAGQAEFLMRTCMIGVLWMPTIFTHFVSHLVQKKFPILIHVVNYSLSTIFTLTVYSQLYATGVGPHLVFPYWLIPGITFHLAIIHFFVNVLYSHTMMFLELKNARGRLHEQLLHVLVGTSIGYLAGSTNYFAWYRIDIPPVLNILVTVYVGSVAYAIVAHRLFEIDLLLHQVITGLTYFFTVMGIALSVMNLNEGLLSILFEKTNSRIILATIGALLAFALIPLYRGIDFVSEKLILRGKYKYLQSVRDFILHDISGYFTIPQFQKEVSKVLINEWGLDPVYIFLPGDYVKGGHRWVGSYVVWDPEESYEEQRGPVIQKESPEMEIISQNAILTREDVEKSAKDAGLLPELRDLYFSLKIRMEEWGSEVIVPLYFSSETDSMLTAVISLGRKKRSGQFTRSDFELVHFIYEKAPQAFYNALMHERDTLVGKKQAGIIQEIGDLYRTTEAERQKYKKGYDLGVDLTSKLAYTTQVLRETQDKLKKAERVAATARMSVTVRHEVNNALAPAAMSVALVKDAVEKGKMEGKDQVIQNLQMTQEGLDRVTKLMRDLERIQEDPAVKEYLPGQEMVDIESSIKKEDDKK